MTLNFECYLTPKLMITDIKHQSIDLRHHDPEAVEAFVKCPYGFSVNDALEPEYRDCLLIHLHDLAYEHGLSELTQQVVQHLRYELITTLKLDISSIQSQRVGSGSWSSIFGQMTR